MFRLLTWNSPEWVWPRGDVDLARGDLAECLPAIRLLPRVMSLWLRVYSDILMHVERMAVDRWALSMEVSPDTWLEGELRIHVHASFQKWH
eukprot:7158291-Prorocentrum_lima.AAC.1